jgi:hypothetical protein
MPQGNCIGWLADDRLYLQSDATFRVVQQMADQQHAPLAVSQRTMHRRLYDQGLLRLQESRKQLTVTRHIGPGKRAESVLDVGLSVMTPENSTFSTFSTPEPESQQNQALAEVLFPAWYSPKQHPKQHLDADAEVSPRGGAISVAVSNHQTAPETCSQRLINQWQVLEVLKVLFADVYRAPQDGALYARFNTNGSGWPLARCETTAPPADAPSPPATLTPGLPACAVCGGTERWDNGGTPHCVVCWPPSRASP